MHDKAFRLGATKQERERGHTQGGRGALSTHTAGAFKPCAATPAAAASASLTEASAYTHSSPSKTCGAHTRVL